MIRIISAEFVKSAVKPEGYPPPNWAEIAFAGKSNVGKSSLINTILSRKMIAKVSSTPGKTRLLNFFKVDFLFESNQPGVLSITDLPGYGYARVSKTERALWQKMIDQYLLTRTNLNGLILIVDIRHQADPKDRMMLAFLKEHNIPRIVIATKADKIAKTKRGFYLKRLQQELELEKDQLIGFSSLQKLGSEAVLEWVEKRITSDI
ncbi:MAG: YihA family ribosome biogenesis GTP-binding protein [Candidatus Cloacimonetes bacterium]|nr:YihA family ribosome biogenesis GTP-binding protein [Candidatus Cloacimonadota bacterium]